MMNKNSKYRLIFLFWVFALNSAIIKSQALDSLINEAYLNNPQLKSLNFLINSSEYKAKSVDALPPPTLGFEISQMPFNSLNWINQPFSQNLTFSQMFPIGGKIEAMFNAEKSNVNIQKQNLEVYKINLKANIKMTYYTIWLLNRKAEIQEETIRLLEELLNSVNALYEINRISQADIYTLKSEIALNQTQLIILNNQLDAENNKLNKFLGRDLNSAKVNIGNDLTFYRFNYSREELDAMLVENNPSIKRMNAMIEMNKLEIIANNKEKIPDLMLQGMVMRMPKGMPVTTQTPPDMITGMGSVNYGYSLMASITLPFAPWTKDKYEAKEQEIENKISGIQEEINDMKRDMLSQLNTSYIKMKTSWELIELYSSKVLPLYEQARTSQISSYQVNQANITTVIDASRMLLMQKMNFLMAEADYKMAIAEIEMMAGKPLNK